jgi:hypothetical protein
MAKLRSLWTMIYSIEFEETDYATHIPFARGGTWHLRLRDDRGGTDAGAGRGNAWQGRDGDTRG